MKKNLLAIIGMVGLAIIVILSVYDLSRKQKARNVAKDYFRHAVRRDCYSEDRVGNFFCDCIIEEALDDYNPYNLLTRYNEDSYDTFKEINDKYYEGCIQKGIEAKIKGKI